MKHLTYLVMALMIMSCSTDPISEEIITADAKANVERKGKPQRSVYFKPSVNSTLRLASGRIMEEPVEYTGDLTGIETTVDWDNDGVEDEFKVNERCYFPRSFQDITVNGEVINYSATYRTLIVGFKDVDGDGFKDAIMRGGRSVAYNDPSEPITIAPYWDANTSYNAGDYVKFYEQCCAPTTYYCMVANTGETPSAESTSWRVALNVGYNVEGQFPTPLKDIVQSLTITSADPSPEYIKWDLSEFGYHNYTFHVYLFNKNLGDYVQTMTYGEYGFYTGGRIIPGDVYVLRFTNLGDDCTDIDVEFTL